MSKEELLEEIFLKFAYVDFKNKPDWKGLNLFGSQLNVLPIYLVLVVINVEKVFGIRLKEQDIIKEPFLSFNQMLLLIKSGT